ncbi:aspartyl protease family protein [Pelagihabitans pacificus]|uniref:aspartyl protease family protein n=1 Tax=Pelagihabitans pacificus TaxID=2696054 RepID=UPI00293BB8D2|nr:PDZ domain-containing protein [Pelagihabitans pacificus]
MKFELINNLIVIPMEVNGSELSFILDSGVGKPILFNLFDQDSLQINKVSEITIRGLGDGEPIEALSSKENHFKLGGIENRDQQLYVVLDKNMNFSPNLGIPIHGIIGYDLFRDFVVDINYASKTIKFHDPISYKYKTGKKYETLPLSIIRKKAYVTGEVFLKDEENIPVRLLVDSGSSDAIWLFENEEIDIPDKNYEDFLGKGLNGDIFGKRTMVKGFKIGSFVLEDAKAAFPDAASFNEIKNLGDRNGSLGGEVLKRFNIIFDYPKGQITLRKNHSFNDPFQYNMSGLDLQHDGLRYISERITDQRGILRNDKNKGGFGNVQLLFQNQTRLSLVPEIIVSGIRAGSPAAEAGLREGDVILAVNGKKVHTYKLQEILHMLNEKEGKRIKVLIERSNSDLLFSFVLKNMFKEKP